MLSQLSYPGAPQLSDFLGQTRVIYSQKCREVTIEWSPMLDPHVKGPLMLNIIGIMDMSSVAK